jgi:hypothetical protein
VRKRSILALIIASSMISVLSLDTVTYAASGDSLILGRHNATSQGTALERYGDGPALILQTRKSSPPLRVDSSQKVVGLNADQIDGLDAAALQMKAVTYNILGTGDFARVRYARIPAPPGTYLVSLRLNLAGAFNSLDVVRCELGYGSERTWAAKMVTFAQARDASGDHEAVVSGSDVFTIPPLDSATMSLACRSQYSTEFDFYEGSRIVLVPLASEKVVDITSGSQQ